MRRYFLLLLIFILNQNLFAQKSVIISSDYDKWPYLQNHEVPVFSGNGKYLAYNIKNGTNLCLIIQSTTNDWMMKFRNGTKGIPRITLDNRHCVFLTRGDSLTILNLENKKINYIPNVSSFDMSVSGSEQRLVYQSEYMNKRLVIRDLNTGKEKIFPNTLMYYLSEDGNALVIQRFSTNDRATTFLDWINISNDKINSIQKGKEAHEIVLDFKHSQVAFRINDSIFYYKTGTSKARYLIDLNSMSLESKLTSFGLTAFSNDGKRLHLVLHNKKNQSDVKVSPNVVEVWSYKDLKPQSLQESELGQSDSYKAEICLIDRKFILLQKYRDEFFFNGDEYNDVILMHHNSGEWYGEFNWNSSSQYSFDLINGKTGERRSLSWLNEKSRLQEVYKPEISANGNYIIYYDTKSNNYFSYSIPSGQQRCLTKDIKVSWLSASNKNNFPRGLIGWSKNDEYFLVYDKYDIWKIDPSGKVLPINLTNGYGLVHHVVFSLALKIDPKHEFKKDEQLLLSAFNTENKNNGFYNMKIGNSNNPDFLTMGPYLYKIDSHNTFFGVYDFTPIKAGNSNKWIVRRMSAVDAPNYFLTTDFKTFKQLSNLQPQKNYNWYTTELHTWKSLDGNSLQGILYKPENFDPSKRYPIIFQCYERLSDGLNAYIKPELTQGQLDIPTFVSKGYLVFCPDIYYKIGDPMQGTYDALVSAVKYVSTLSFVDSKKMGIQGHSFGGFQVNSLITRTNLFVAACTSSGQSDWVSAYGSLYGNLSEGFSVPLAGNYELGQIGMGTSLWGNLEGYIKNSPIFKADKVTTPLLMKHGRLDSMCPYANELEFFLGLRRLGKKAWMLVYPEASHCLFGDDAEDFATRMQQFFDHYLKDKPAPMWMLDGISASRRGIDTGLKLDSTGRTPGSGLLTPEEQNKVDSLMTRKPITITLK